MLGAMLQTTALTALTPEVEAAIAAEVNQRLNAEFMPADLLNGTSEKKRAISDTIKRHTASALRSRNLRVAPTDETELAERLIAQTLGYGFLDRLLSAGEVSEIAGNPDGSWSATDGPHRKAQWRRLIG